MRTIDFYFDFISPYAWLAFARWPEAMQGISHQVRYHPVLFAAMLDRYGQLGPAEIGPKRDWTYRQVQWLAQAQNIPLHLPASHPFNSLPYLRLACAAALSAPSSVGAQPLPTPSRYVCETVFRHLWCTGADAQQDAHIDALRKTLALDIEADAAPVKQLLRAHTDAALAEGVFGVPSFAVDGKLFWGQDALPMLAAYCRGESWFDSGAWEAAAAWPAGAVRTRAKPPQA